MSHAKRTCMSAPQVNCSRQRGGRLCCKSRKFRPDRPPSCPLLGAYLPPPPVTAKVAIDPERASARISCCGSEGGFSPIKSLV
jgi:hypothetical protein